MKDVHYLTEYFRNLKAALDWGLNIKSKICFNNRFVSEFRSMKFSKEVVHPK